VPPHFWKALLIIPYIKGSMTQYRPKLVPTLAVSHRRVKIFQWRGPDTTRTALGWLRMAWMKDNPEARSLEGLKTLG